MKRMKFLNTIGLLLVGFLSFSQVSKTLEQCEDLFLSNNLLLLAEQYNVDMANAMVMQAKIWERPYLSGEINAINPSQNRMFDAGKNGQKVLAVSQLIYLGGKKKKEISWAQSNVNLAALEFEQLTRNLKFEIRKNFYDIYFSQLKSKSIQVQLSNIDTLINNYSAQAVKGNIPLKDVVRLQSLSLSLKNELLDIQKNINNDLEILKILTNTTDDIIAVVNSKTIESQMLKELALSESEIQKKALEQNTAYLLAEKQIESQTLLVQWEKSKTVPDLNLGANYDQRGGAFNNQVNLTFGVPLPLWNSNKGNIKIAEAELGQVQMQQKQVELELNSKINNAIKSFKTQQKQYNETVSNFQNFDIVYSGILKNFQQRNISLIEFTDFMESYNQSIMYINDIKKQLIINGETLNYLTNENIF